MGILRTRWDHQASDTDTHLILYIPDFSLVCSLRACLAFFSRISLNGSMFNDAIAAPCINFSNAQQPHSRPPRVAHTHRPGNAPVARLCTDQPFFSRNTLPVDDHPGPRRNLNWLYDDETDGYTVCKGDPHEWTRKDLSWPEQY